MASGVKLTPKIDDEPYPGFPGNNGARMHRFGGTCSQYMLPAGAPSGQYPPKRKMAASQSPRSVGLSGAALFLDLARCKSALQTDIARCCLGNYSTAPGDDDFHVVLWPVRGRCLRRHTLSAVRLCRPLAMDVFLECGNQQR